MRCEKKPGNTGRQITIDIHSIQSESAGLYVHIPFCIQKCSYCDFCSITDLSLIRALVNALLKEAKMVAGQKRLPDRFDTLYFGGGTPSLLGTIDISRVIETVRTLFPISPDAELSIETNPGAIEPKHCADYQNAGVNRINIGVQSFSDANLKFLGRIHSSRDAVAAVKSIRRAGFNNLGLDLIYGIPGQSKKSWLIDLDKAMEFQPEHLSCYMLTYEPGTPMHQDLQKGCFRPQAEDLTADLFETTMSFLIDHGYVQYEISNFARAKRYMCRHNQKYWSGVPYIGLGPAAHSFVEPVRWRNTQQVKQYIKEIKSGRFAVEGKETLNREQRMMERIYLGLRTTDGIQTDIFDDTFGVRFTERFNKIITDLKERGLIKFSKNRCALTKKGMLFQNSIASMFICSDG